MISAIANLWKKLWDKDMADSKFFDVHYIIEMFYSSIGEQLLMYDTGGVAQCVRIELWFSQIF